MGCFGDCFMDKPPDTILKLPPPPLPSFLLPIRSSLAGNNSQPCFAAFMCESSLSDGVNGIEYIELPRNGHTGVEDTWLFIVVSSLFGVLLLGALFAFLLIKCRESFTCSYHDSNLKHHQTQINSYGGDHDTLNGAHTKTLTHGFLVSNGQLTCAIPSSTMMTSNRQPIQPVDSRLLWATLTPHGTTQHFVSEPYPQEDHYEAVPDYSRKYQACVNDLNSSFSTPKKTINKATFENNGFVDYDYEDPTPLIVDPYNNLQDDMDSGYQEPQFLTGGINGDLHSSSGNVSQMFNRSPLLSSNASTLQRQQRQIVSTPTRIVNQNILPPLNINPQANNHQAHQYRSLNKSKNLTLTHQNNTQLSGVNGTILNKRSANTLNRRISDLSNA